MNIQSSQFLSIKQLQDQYLNPKKEVKETKTSDGLSFKQILEQQSAETTQIKFSKHASNRLAQRNIELTDNQMERLNEGTARAEAKGIKESLVMVDEMAFIVHVPSNTVITAMNQKDASENVFTNIDGAVIM